MEVLRPIAKLEFLYKLIFTWIVPISCVLPWYSPTGHLGSCLPASFLFQLRLDGRENAMRQFHLGVTFFIYLKHIRVQDANNFLEQLKTKETQNILYF